MKIFSDDTVKDYSNTIGKRNEVDNIMTIPLFVQAIMGHNVLDPKWSWKNSLPQHIFVICLQIYVIFGTREFLKDTTDVTAIGEAYYTFLIMAFFPIKYLLFLQTRGTFRSSYLIAKTSLLEMVKTYSTVKSNKFLKKMKLLSNMLFVMVLFPVIVYLLYAFWNYILGTRVTLSKTTSILMPMTTPYYEVGLILHTIFLFYMSFSYIVIDMWFVLLMFFFCEVCEVLVNILNVELKGSDETDLEHAARLNERLKLFYKNHEMIMEYLNTLSEMYKWSSVIPLVSVLAFNCLILFLMTEQVQWAFLSNLPWPLAQIFAYNWFGEQVKVKGIQLNMALLNFDWPSMRVKDKKNYLIIISYMNKELRMQTAVGQDLSLFTMSSVLKASYQAFAVLKSMET